MTYFYPASALRLSRQEKAVSTRCSVMHLPRSAEADPTVDEYISNHA